LGTESADAFISPILHLLLSTIIGQRETAPPRLYFVIDLVVASLGVAIFEASIYRLLPQPATIVGSYWKEFLISAAIAFVLGFFVYWKLIRRTALWVWALGLCLFVVQVIMGLAESEDVDVVGILSLRMIFYSLGALTCSCTLRSGENESGESRQGIASLLWIFGAPPKLPAGAVL
jgi:hypothetical protein